MRTDAIFLVVMVGSFIVPAVGPPLSRGTLIWLVLAAAVTNITLLKFLVRPDHRTRVPLALTCGFSALFATAGLAQLLDFSASLSERSLGWREAPLWLMQSFGKAFAYSMDVPSDATGLPPNHLLLRSLSIIICTGVPEELVKLLPVVAILSLRSLRSLRDVWTLAAFSGVGFGVSEATWNCWRMPAIDQVPMTAYLSRLIGCPLAHCTFTLVAAWLLVRLSARPHSRRVVLKKVWINAVLAGVVIGTIHGAYDAVIEFGYPGVSGVILTLLGLTAVRLNLIPSSPLRQPAAA
jgi:RsiW-degrading membrane proteinase PrsW (M82 family)